ncbi:PREDICTED: amino acid permease 3-like [Lupinus angustifolius]|uniref:amino acid permease 3-like n=1 Tax=Lupinus angustifolius TaxID=3871 RepID=UPI00092E788F|nr:PREDICTED: amino acid permease 3-like [Lupinus angustifolius]
MVENTFETNLSHRQGADSLIDSKYYDDDGRPKRTGGVWITSSHIITAVIGSGVVSLAWSIAQMGWVAGIVVMLFFSVVTWYTSLILADCYRTGDPITGPRNYTFMNAVSSILGGWNVTWCGIAQYSNLFGTAIGYTIGASISMMAIKRSNCFHDSKGADPCHVSANPFMIGFGIVQIFFSQIPNIHEIWWLSIVAAIMSYTYSTIALGLGIAKVAENRTFKGTLTGVSFGDVRKVWGIFQGLGNIAFAYSFSMILIEIQDTIKSPPSEVKTIKKATNISILATTFFYLLCGCSGYAAFGDTVPGNVLTGLGFTNPYWLIDIGNAAIAIHLVGGYQVFVQPLFAFVEKEASKKWPKIDNKTFKIPIPGLSPYNLNLFRLVWRTVFVITTTVISMLIPFFNDVLGLIGALGFWPLTVYFPVEMYILQMKIPKWSRKWVFLQILSVLCLIVSAVATVGSVVGIILDLKDYKPFSVGS